LLGLDLLTVGYLKASGVPRTSLYTAFYYQREKRPENIGEDTYLIPFGILPDGTDLSRDLIIAQLFLFSVDDTGAWVTAAFEDPKTWLGKDMKVCVEWLSTRQMAEISSRVTGKKVLPIEMDEETFHAQKTSADPMTAELYRSKAFVVQVSRIVTVSEPSILDRVE